MAYAQRVRSAVAYTLTYDIRLIEHTTKHIDKRKKGPRLALYKIIHAQLWTQARAHRTRPRQRHGSGPGHVSQRLARHVSP
eukprot:107664-Prymnesium_polylepis.1